MERSENCKEVEVITSGVSAEYKRADRVDDGEFNTESYSPIQENEFLTAAQNPLSTFSIDVDTASYSIVRRHIMDGMLPPASAVRIEEMINYFPYSYPATTGDAPFSVNVEVAGCPWSPGHRLVSIGLHGKQIGQDATTARPGANLVFLLDVSGSMNDPRKLPLVKSALTLLVRQLDGRDDVAIVVYAGASGLVLASTPATGRARSSPRWIEFRPVAAPTAAKDFAWPTRQPASA